MRVIDTEGESEVAKKCVFRQPKEGELNEHRFIIINREDAPGIVRDETEAALIRVFMGVPQTRAEGCQVIKLTASYNTEEEGYVDVEEIDMDDPSDAALHQIAEVVTDFYHSMWGGQPKRYVH